ncbi:putative B3 domain-containing protein Os04g0346900 isoform X4 [Panicum virgatum]|uniref:putative B3 domain-containing protein Os04g0346900 isoform X4 n=1 Tax=Panicum virgatum TaxID=38727 RepID=UPI0019D61BD6|nr:putative B3 domain-containing protein Os04g0346900 isoform X4 [Panicum virgatum]
MASSGDHAAAAKHLRVLLPFTCDSLRIPDELAEEIGAEEALVVGPMGGNGKVLWRVEVGRDGNGAFLGRGWPELADACGVGAGWLLVLRHRGRGVLTVKAFDRTRCLRDLGAPAPSPGGWSQFMVFHDITESNALLVRYEGNMVFTVKVFGTDGIPRDSKQKENRAQQRSTLPHSEKLQKAPSVSIQKHKRKNKTSLGRNSIYKIGPPSWIKKQINTNTLEKHLALAKAFCDAIGLQKPCTITLRTSRADGTKSWLVHGLTCKTSSYLLVQGWRQFCQENHLKEGDTCTFNVIETTLWNVLITRHEEKMNQFCYQETPKSKKNKSNTDGQKMLQGSMNYLNKSRTKSVFEIGPPAWVKKEINASTIENHLNLPLPFCKAIGFRQRCMITLKTSTSSTKSWQACLNLYQNCGQLVGGWKSFCLDNGIRVGDVCTMEIIETTLWNVTVDRREDRTR